MIDEENRNAYREVHIALARSVGLPCSNESDERAIINFASLMLEEAANKCDMVRSLFEFEQFNNGPFFSGEIKGASDCANFLRALADDIKRTTVVTEQP